MMPHFHGNLALLGLALLLCVNAGSATEAPQVTTTPTQRGTLPQSPNSPSAAPAESGTADPFRASMEARRLKMANDDRHKRLVTDTEKLLSLSAELKDDVSKTTKNELSLDVIKKAAEIEKLAHDVKERMRS